MALYFNSVNEILDFAISKEEGAASFYNQLAERMNRTWMVKVFKDFAAEEQGHKAKLQAVKKGGKLEPSKAKIMDLKLAEYLTTSGPSADMEYPEALIQAMKQEKESFRLYTELAGTTSDASLRDVFLFLAQEEAKHKLRFELEYDEVVLKEN